MNSFSPNMLKTFEACPQKYYFKYIEKISVPQKSNLFEKGKKVHALANYYLRGDDISKMEKALNSEELKLWEILKQNEFFNKKYIASEYNISSRIENFWIGGRLDALMQDEQNYYILDYKTGTIPQNPETDFQTIIYLTSTDKMLSNKKNLYFVYIDLKNNQNQIIEFTQQTKENYKNFLIKKCNMILNTKNFEEKKNRKNCTFCEYNKMCN
jgi:CRISPR/Cas system-associated exonuclease Cas4 (RecB family)